jgi:hypothetical protein
MQTFVERTLLERIMTTPMRLVMTMAFAMTTGLQALSASAQIPGQPYSTLKTLQGYEPSIVGSEAEALALYQSMPTDIFKAKSECHQRAHHWAYYNFNQSHGLKTMKVYLFFTDRYKREFDYVWGYHVAPLIPVRLADGTVEEQVFDPTFTSMPSWEDRANADRYDNKPVPISEWIKYFIYPEVECPVVENFNDYFKYQDRYYCYVMKTPMYNYIPDSLETETQPRASWREGDLLEMRNALKNK